MEIHPLSYKALSKGHFWITQDAYTKRFPKSLFLQAKKRGERKFLLFLNDPKHPKVKARLWRKDLVSSQYGHDQFSYDLERRLKKAFELRERQKLDRENTYLAFGEADELPGLFILKLGPHVLIQAYSYFWEQKKEVLLKKLSSLQPCQSIWFQIRGKNQSPPQLLWGRGSAVFQVKEFGVNYQVNLNSKYDIGIYTDMASVRSQLPPSIFQGKSILNLYAYTGAFSLYALAQGAREVTSVDLSQEYLNTLQKNLELNPELPSKAHQSVQSSCELFLRRRGKYDLIIMDPPSFSGDGKKRTSAIKRYEKEVPLMIANLSPEGRILLFSNTHHISRRKFKEQLLKILSSHKYRVEKEFSLSQDCPRKRGFLEGDYLKGFLLCSS